MMDRPILFSGEMVRAILDGRKTQTRLVIKPQPLKFPNMHPVGQSEVFREFVKKHPCPYEVGMRLWVRETWATELMLDLTNPSNIAPGVQVWFRATKESWDESVVSDLYSRGKIRPSIFMPRWASRITLEVVNIRVERVQDISIDDSLREGYPNHGNDGARWGFRPIVWFAELWNSINAKRGYGWDTNPYVWIVEFKVLQ